VLDRLGEPMSTGIGLANVRERLRVIYGATYHLILTSEPGKGTKARIEVPELVAQEPVSA
jgi:two-component system, LytTR family, sensor kinase